MTLNVNYWPQQQYIQHLDLTVAINLLIVNDSYGHYHNRWSRLSFRWITI